MGVRAQTSVLIFARVVLILSPYSCDDEKHESGNLGHKTRVPSLSGLRSEHAELEEPQLMSIVRTVAALSGKKIS